MLERKPQGATAYTEPTSSGFSGLLWMFFGAIITLVIGVFVYKSPMFGFSAPDSQVMQSDEPTVKPKVQADKDNPDYQFYDLLPEQKSQRIPEAAPPAKVVEEKIEKKAKNLKADVVVKKPFVPEVTTETLQGAENSQATAEQTTSNGTSTTKDTTATSAHSHSAPVADEGEMIIVYENSTYGDADKANIIVASKSTDDSGIVKTTTVTQVNQASKDAIVANDINSLSITETRTETKSQQTNQQTTPSTKPVQAPTNSGSIIKNAKDSGAAKIQAVTQAEQKVKPRKSYILQVNTYDNADEADTRRAQVLMTGIDAQVSKKQVNGHIVYQVVTTQMTSPEAVVRAQQNLQKNGIGSIVVEQRLH